MSAIICNGCNANRQTNWRQRNDGQCCIRTLHCVNDINSFSLSRTTMEIYLYCSALLSPEFMGAWIYANSADWLRHVYISHNGSLAMVRARRFVLSLSRATRALHSLARCCRSVAATLDTGCRDVTDVCEWLRAGAYENSSGVTGRNQRVRLRCPSPMPLYC